jgi:hypothetical protein
VDQRQARDQPVVFQVGEVLRELRGGEHPLVDERAAGEAGDREAGEVALLHDAADHVQLALQCRLVLHAVAGGHEQLADARRGGAGGDATVVLVHGHVAPAQHALTLLLDGVLQQADGVLAGELVAGQEAHGHAVAPRLGQLEARLGAHQLVGQLHEDAGAVARIRVGALGAAVLQVLERPQRTRDHLMGGGRAQARHEGNTASIVLVGRVVQAVTGPAVGGCHQLFLGFRAFFERARDGCEPK